MTVTVLAEPAALRVYAPATPELRLLSAVPLERNPAAVYLARLAPGSRRTMREALDTIGGMLTRSARADAFAIDWPQVRYQHSQAVRSLLAERYAPATANKMLSALRGVLEESWRLGYMSAEDRLRASDLGVIRGSSEPPGRALTVGELSALVDACRQDSTPSGARDAALLALLFAGGLRRSEAVAIDVDDLDTETGAIRVRAGKGRKERTVYAINGASEALADWLAVRGRDAGPLLVPVARGGRLVMRRLHSQAIYNALRRRADEAGVRRFMPHDLRRTCISEMLEAGADLATTQRYAGHASPTTTARYDRRPEAAKRAAAARLHFPYVSRAGA